jgi:Fungal Zn(2)-Cys(6) binuclear cluster domain
MSSAGNVHEYRPTEKPTASCTSCRRRKLRCDREPQGCRNCSKAELPCLYPPPEETTKRKRGPYQKDKTQRERELEHAVKAMEVKCEQLAGQVQNKSESEGSTGSMYGLPEGFFMLPDGHKKASTGTNKPDRSSAHFQRSSASAIDAAQPQMRLSPANAPPSDDRDFRLKNRFWSNFSNEVSHGCL